MASVGPELTQTFFTDTNLSRMVGYQAVLLETLFRGALMDFGGIVCGGLSGYKLPVNGLFLFNA